ncbi:hypothetical protein [Dactylosporangium sp. CA-233914]|uniref:hypothetical protein n=1 Tax=Dactylosporangium sp. CA-233914 TaxID=3239934 RepID=UPI003D91D969
MSGLAEMLDDIADQAKVYDVTEVAVRGARRRRRARIAGRAGLGVLVVACLLGGVVSVLPLFRFGGIGGPEGGPGRLDGEPSAVVRPLLDSPTRGPLAGDAAFLNSVLDRIVADPEQFGLPGDRARLRVLFAGDVPGNRRLVIVAGATAAPRKVNLLGPRGAKAERLNLANWGDLGEPIVWDEWRGGEHNSGYVLVLSPIDYDVSVSSAPRYLADGSITREWQAEPAGYLLRDTATLPAGLRVRFRGGNKVFYEGSVPSGRTGTVDPSPLYGRGKPAPRAAEVAANALAYQFGLTGPDVHYVVLWSDDFEVVDPDGQGSGLGQIATVMALTADGGGPYITIATDTSPQPNSRNHPTGAGIAGDPAKALIAMRLPTFSADEPDTLQIIAPPAAARFEVRQGETVLAQGALTGGVGQIELPGPLNATVRAYDDTGTVIAERPFVDLTPGTGPTNYTEPEIRGW